MFRFAHSCPIALSLAVFITTTASAAHENTKLARSIPDTAKSKASLLTFAYYNPVPHLEDQQETRGNQSRWYRRKHGSKTSVSTWNVLNAMAPCLRNFSFYNQVRRVKPLYRPRTQWNHL